eukprot:TRINITY_DN38_c0_g1_i1.p1 TRINITY_DN38_c0_g1~~TRINITY_DN38_c0_g1_i1.p1  ORF type:complete len:696 (+),score=216.72 TRINITY_DN38_c0_g1_i1:113-2089(+)
MYNQRAKRDEDGKILFEAYQSKDKSHQARIQPDRRWFGPTRTVQQHELQQFRDELEKQRKDPNVYILKQAKLPMSLLRDPQKEARANLLGVETFKDTFGAKSKRKRPKLAVNDVSELATHVMSKAEGYNEDTDKNIKKELDYRVKKREAIYYKGTSHRIWGELHKVLDSSDVVVEVLDARDPMGTRAFHVEEHIKKNMPHKHILLLLNKADLVPTWALKRWLYTLSKEFPVLAFHSSLTKPFGKGSLIQVLRQFQHLHSDKQQISVGFIGYPNVGKSSVINTLRSKKVCPVAPVPGETKVWRYITLFKKIFLVDCPGVVYPTADTESDIVLKGVVRVENLEEPVEHIPALVARVRPEHLAKTYGVEQWSDAMDFVEQFARKSGRLLKGGEPDMNTVAKMMLNDWLRGKIPFFVPPPQPTEEEQKRIDADKQRQKEEREAALAAAIAAGLNPRKQSLKTLATREEFANEAMDDDEDDDGIVSDSEEEYSDQVDDDDDRDDEVLSFDLSDLDAEAEEAEQANNKKKKASKSSKAAEDDDDDEDDDGDAALDWETVLGAAGGKVSSTAASSSSAKPKSAKPATKASPKPKKQPKQKKAKKSFGESVAAEIDALDRQGTRNKKRKRGANKDGKKDGKDQGESFEVVPVGYRKPKRQADSDDE